MRRKLLMISCLFMLSSALSIAAWAGSIVHDAEYYILHAQNGKKWAAEDKELDQRLAELRKKNGGKPPNIVYILLDDVGFGEIGMDEISVIRGYKTPNITALAKEGLSLQRMYTEPSCTPTRVAMMTGRYPTRTGLTEAKATLAGDGLHAEEVTLAEVLRDAGYYTSHVGKWHLGDIEQAYASNQGFIHAEFPIHQQAQLAIMAREHQFSVQSSQVIQKPASVLCKWMPVSIPVICCFVKKFPSMRMIPAPLSATG